MTGTKLKTTTTKTTKRRSQAAVPTVRTLIPHWREWMDSIGQSQKSILNKTTYVERWASDAGTADHPLTRIEERHVDRWVNDKRLTSKSHTRTVMLASVRNFFQFAAAKRLVQSDPTMLVRVKLNQLTWEQKEKKERGCFSDSDLAKVEKYLCKEIQETGKALVVRTSNRTPLEEKLNTLQFWKLAFRIGRWTGLRMGDIAQLEWSSMSKPGKLVVWTEKRDRRVELPLGVRSLVEALAMIPLPDNSKERFCFPRQAAIYADVSKRALLSVQSKRILRRAGVNNLTFHELRHTYASECAKAGIPTPHIARSMGHASEGTTRGYIHA